jgi:hypothetical protein
VLCHESTGVSQCERSSDFKIVPVMPRNCCFNVRGNLSHCVSHFFIIHPHISSFLTSLPVFIPFPFYFQPILVLETSSKPTPAVSVRHARPPLTNAHRRISLLRTQLDTLHSRCLAHRCFPPFHRLQRRRGVLAVHRCLKL